MHNVIAVPRGRPGVACTFIPTSKLTEFTTVHCFSGLKNSNNNQNVDTYLAT
jgi:hypothetical protein